MVKEEGVQKVTSGMINIKNRRIRLVDKSGLYVNTLACARCHAEGEPLQR